MKAHTPTNMCTNGACMQARCHACVHAQMYAFTVLHISSYTNITLGPSLSRGLSCVIPSINGRRRDKFEAILCALTRLRIGVHNLQVNLGRHHNPVIPLNNRICFNQEGRRISS